LPGSYAGLFTSGLAYFVVPELGVVEQDQPAVFTSCELPAVRERRCRSRSAVFGESGDLVGKSALFLMISS
jgi:hypothetical protein